MIKIYEDNGNVIKDIIKICQDNGICKNHLKVLIEQKIAHCVTDNDSNLHLDFYTNRFIIQIVHKKREHAIPKNFNMSIQIICKY